MKKVLLAHGGGGEDTRALISEVFSRHFSNAFLDMLEDSAVLPVNGGAIAFTTDTFTVFPYFFQGGDIGKLSVAGTVNDLSVMGARPLFLSAGYVIEEGFPMPDLERIAESMSREAVTAGVQVVTGDTKVMPRGQLNGIIINTAGIGEVVRSGLSASAVRPGDRIIVTGSVGDHGACILASREGIDFTLDMESDCASLWGLLEGVVSSNFSIHAMRDPTRGGLAAVLTEWAHQSSVEIEVMEEDIPVRDAVRGACELLGMEPTHLASEGRAVIAVEGDHAEVVLEMLRNHPLGRESRMIGTVLPEGKPRVILRSSYNTRRVMEPPSGELLPRIC